MLLFLGWRKEEAAWNEEDGLGREEEEGGEPGESGTGGQAVERRKELFLRTEAHWTVAVDICRKQGLMVLI